MIPGRRSDARHSARAARPDELDDLVDLLCEAFDLPFGPARDLVRADPYFDLSRKRVLVGEDGRVLSCLTVVEQKMRIGDALVPIAGIAGVATREAHRGQGLATELLRETMHWLRGEGYGLAALLAADPRCYRRLGWEVAGRHFRLTAPASGVPASAERARVRTASREDIAAISRLYDECAGGATGACERDAKRWDYVWEHAGDRFVYAGEGIEGYALAERRGRDGDEHVRVGELVARTDRARAGLASALAFGADGAELRYTAGRRAVEESGLLVVGARVDVLPGAMFRVLDLPRALSALAPNLRGWSGSLVCHMSDEVMAAGVGRIACIEGDGSAVTIREAPPTAHADLTGDAAAWSALLPGGASLEAACATGRIGPRSSAIVSAAATLFPWRDPAIPAPDYF